MIPLQDEAGIKTQITRLRELLVDMAFRGCNGEPHFTQIGGEAPFYSFPHRNPFLLDRLA